MEPFFLLDGGAFALAPGSRVESLSETAFDPTATLAAPLRSVRHLIRQRTLSVLAERIGPSLTHNKHWPDSPAANGLQNRFNTF